MPLAVAQRRLLCFLDSPVGTLSFIRLIFQPLRKGKLIRLSPLLTLWYTRILMALFLWTTFRRMVIIRLLKLMRITTTSTTHRN
jgi:hypothetical protein